MQRGRVGLAVALAVSLTSGIALAQPGQPYPQQPAPYPQQPAPYPQQPAPYPQPAPYGQPYAPPPYAYQPRQPIQLTAEEAELLQRGVITDGEILGGGLLAIFLGFGSGQAVQGRWGDTGWIFTLGDVGSIALMIAGAVQCANHDDGYINDERNTGCTDRDVGMIVAGLIGYGVFRIWESVDAFVGPTSHNHKFHALQARMYGYGSYPGYSFYMKPTMNNEGTVAGLTLRF